MRSKPASAADIRLPKHSPFGPLPEPKATRPHGISRSAVGLIEKAAIEKMAAALKARGISASDLL